MISLVALLAPLIIGLAPSQSAAVVPTLLHAHDFTPSTCLKEKENLAQLDPSITLSNFGRSFITADEAREIALSIAKRQDGPVLKLNTSPTVSEAGLCYWVSFKNGVRPDPAAGIPDHWTLVIRKENGEIVAIR